jgi:glycosyltransferase involved in cell wall biosynthesis
MVVTLCEGQRRRGHRVLAGVRGHSALEGVLSQRSVEMPVRSIGQLDAAFKVAEVVRRERVDVLHTHLTSGAYAAFGASLLTGAPVAVHAHVYNRDLIFRAASKRGRLIAVSQSASDYYVSRIRIPDERVVVVQNGSPMREAPEARISKETLRRSVIEEFELSDRAKLVLHAARVTRQKGQDLTVAAAQQVLRRHPDAVFLIVGTHEEPGFFAKLAEEARAQGLLGSVRFLGFRSDIARFYRAASVALVPSRFDPYPLGVIEPMLLETPVIGAKVGGIAEILQDPEVGVSIEPDSAGALAEATIRLLENPEQAQAIARQALAVARDRFSVDAMLDRIDSVYDQVAHRPQLALARRAGR